MKDQRPEHDMRVSGQFLLQKVLQKQKSLKILNSGKLYAVHKQKS